jgi:hypothetical protein
MKTTKLQTIKLRKETLQRLEGSELRAVAGGSAGFTFTANNACANSEPCSYLGSQFH